MFTRRSFLAAAASTCAARVLCGASESRKKIAFLATVGQQHSHAQHFLDRHTLGYTWRGAWQTPRFDVAAVYVDQFPAGDLARERIRRHGLRQFPTIAEALTLGGSQLAVDGVVIIAEGVSNKGRVDLTLQVGGRTFLFEFKVSDGEPLEQIKRMKYYEKYEGERYLIGIVFDPKERNVSKFEWEKV